MHLHVVAPSIPTRRSSDLVTPTNTHAIIRTGESKVNARATSRQHQRRGAVSPLASLRPHAHKRLAAAFGDQLVVLRSEEHTSELQSLRHLVCRLLLEKKKK